MKTVQYYLLSFLSFLISLIGFIGLKLAVIATAIGVAFLTDRYFGKLGLIAGWITGLFVGGLLLTGLKRLSPYLERLDDHTKTFKKYLFAKKYRKDYPQPKPEDFGITQIEFADYNKRFQFEYLKLIFTYGLFIAISVYVLRDKVRGNSAILLLGGVAVVAILLNYLFDHLNKKVSQRHRYYEKIHKYQEALNIYFRVRDENSTV